MKTNVRKRLSRVLAVFMTVFMLTGMLPQTAFAAESADTDGVVISSGIEKSTKMKQITFVGLSGTAQNTGTDTYEVILDPATDTSKKVEIEIQWVFAKVISKMNYLGIINGENKYFTASKVSDSKMNPVYPCEIKGTVYTIKYNTATEDSGVNYFVPAWENIDGTLQTTLQFGYASKNTAKKLTNPVTVVLKIGTGEAINQQPTITGDVEKKETINKNEERTYDVTDKFTDPEGEALTYFYSIDSDKEEDYQPLQDGKLTMKFTKDVGTSDDYVLRFKAFDGEKYSAAYTVRLNVINNKPVLNSGVKDKNISVYVNEPVEIDWSDIFSDPNGDPLTYKVKMPGTDKFNQTFEDAKYTCVYGIPGTYAFEIKAYDDQNQGSDKNYTVTVEVKEPEAAPPNFDETYDVTVNVPEGFIPQFYITKTAGYNAVDDYYKDEYELEYEAGKTSNGFTEWTVKVPENIGRISYRAADADGNSWGGMSIETKGEDGTVAGAVNLRPFKGLIKTRIDGQALTAEQGEFKVKTYEGSWAESGGSDSDGGYLYYRYLLAAYDNKATYTYYAVPKGNLTKTYSEAVADFNPITPESADADVYPLPFNLASGFTIIAPEDADVKVFNQERYYKATEQPCVNKVSRNGTVEWHFAKIGNGANMSYRVSMEDKITKIGYVTGDSVTITWDDDIAPDERVDYDLTTTYGKRAEDSIYLNVNGQNALVLNGNEAFTLRPFRAWQLINSEVDNIMIEPDFTYNVISGGDVISVAPVSDYNMNATNNRLQINAKANGIAIIEIGYDAVAFEGGEESVYEGSGWEKTFQGQMTYGAVDPARTGLVVVQVGNAADDVDFGIQFADSANRAWDAEHDTVYFLGDKGQVSFKPSVNRGTISEVAVSNDKGASWKALDADNGTYTADIVSGNNMIRVKKSDGTEAYQVVRGDKLTVTLHDSSNNGRVEAGEEIKITISGMHHPASKMSGIYNPGGVTTSYTFNGKKVSNQTAQYQVSLTSLMITVPEDAEDGSEIRLSDGKTGTTWMGDPLGSHRDITDAGKNMNGTASSRSYSFNILPDITFAVGDDAVKDEQDKENRAPALKEGVEATGEPVTVKVGKVYQLSLGTVFEDADGDTLNYSASVNGADAETVSKNYSFVPAKEGSYTIVFTANDGQADSEDTYTVTVTAEGTVEKPELEFDIAEDEIAGYVTVSFEDYGVRLENEKEDMDVLYREPLGEIVGAAEVPFAEYDTIASVTLRLLDAMGMYAGYNGTEYSGFYLTSIGKFVANGNYYETFGEKQAGDGSGWMVTLNKGGTGDDWFINRGANAFVVGDGDIIKWKYTCQIGSDIREDTAVSAVERLIESIGSPVTLEDLDEVKAAREAYDALTLSQKSKISNYEKLTAAEKQIENLISNNATDEDRAAAAAVDKLIKEIGMVTADSGDKIKAARSAYEQLTPLQKELVTKLSLLETAENKFRQINSSLHREVYNKTGAYISGLGTPGVGSVGGEWMTIGLARGNKGADKIAEGYFNNVVQYMEQVFQADAELKNDVRLHGSKSTDNSRVILALTAAGFDATDVNGYNLFDGLDDMEYIKYQGINGPVWALIAMNAHPDYKDELSNVTEEDLIDEILSAQLADGGWDLRNEYADTDMTAMAVQALAPYYGTDDKVKKAVDKSLDKLSSMQLPDGGFASVDGQNSESIAQVIVALTALGIDPEEDERFIKKGISVVDALCESAVKGGGFSHTKGGELDGMATEQGYYALAAYFRLLDGKTALYDMSDVKLTGGIADPDHSGNGDADKSEEAASSEEKAETKSLTKSAKIKLGKTKAAKAVISKINAVTGELPENAADYTEEHIQKLIDVYKAYDKLNALEKLAVRKDGSYKAFQQAMDNAGRIHHYDKAAEIDARDNDEKNLPWYVKLMVKPEQLTDAQISAVKAALGDDSEVYTVNDIYFVNMLDDSEWHPENTLRIKMPMVDIGDHSNAVIVHIDSEGKVEIISGTVEDGKIIFEAADFSLYGIAGTDATVKAMLASETPVIWPWIAAAAAAVILLAIILYRRKHSTVAK